MPGNQSSTYVCIERSVRADDYLVIAILQRLMFVFKFATMFYKFTDLKRDLTRDETQNRSQLKPKTDLS